MNLILADFAAQYRSETLHQEAEENRLAALVKGTATRRRVAGGALSRAVGRIGLALRGGAAA